MYSNVWSLGVKNWGSGTAADKFYRTKEPNLNHCYGIKNDE